MIAEAGQLDGQMISSDALHTHKELAIRTVEQGEEYIQQVKSNQPTLRKQVINQSKDAPLFCSTQTDHTDDL